MSSTLTGNPPTESGFREKKRSEESMASKEELKKIAVKSVEDDKFRDAFEKDPIKAAASMGITLTEAQVKDIKAHASKVQAAGIRESKGFISSVLSSS